MGLKRKEIDILLNIMENPLSVRELSEKLGDSERNLRYSVENLEYYLKNLIDKEIVKKNKKLSASLTEKEVDSFLCSVRKGDYIYSIDERMEYILNTFLFVDDPKLRDIEEDLEVSRTTIKKDMAALQDYLEKYDLHFEQEGNRVSIGGNEKKLRHLIMLKMIRYIDEAKKGLYPVENRIRETIEKRKRDLQVGADEILEKIEKKLREDFSKEFKRIMRYYLWVTLFRIEKGRYIVKKHNSNFLRKTHYYEVIRGVVKDYIDDELEYEILHLTEYFLSGSSDKEYYEERVAIELFTYELLKETEGRTGGEVFEKKLFREITGYLTSAIYRMKNNFVLRSEKRFVPEDEVGQAVYDVCMNDSYLSESLRDEEISHIEGLIKKRIQEDSIKFIELKKLLNIVKRSSEGLDEERLSAELLGEYGRWIIPDCKEEMKVLKDLLLLATDIEGSSIEEIAGRGSKVFKEAGVLRKETGFYGYTAAKIFKSEETECYYVTNEDIVAKSGIIITPVRGSKRVVVLLALKDEISYLDALWELEKTVEKGLVKTLGTS